MDSIENFSELNLSDQCLMAGRISPQFFEASLGSIMETVTGADAHCYLAFFGC